MSLFSGTPLRAILVSVDYGDYLQITLPYNRHHFDEVLVITTKEDQYSRFTAEDNNATVFETDAFYRGGAYFNKWLALEEGFDYFGREGWIVNIDADILWPIHIPDFELQEGCIYTPYRRMAGNIKTLPVESEWENFGRHRVQEFSGFTQIFNAADPALGEPPWFQTNWKHAGGADSFFQRKWGSHNKIRPTFEVLHLGNPGTNWLGRATPNLVDGYLPKEASERIAKLREYMRQRRTSKGKDPYEHERIEDTI